jgi:hypothetical protein
MLKKFLTGAVVLGSFAVSAAIPQAALDLPLDEGDLKKIADTTPGKARVNVFNPEFLQWVEGADGQALQFNNAFGKVKRGQVAVKWPAKVDVSKAFTVSYTFKTAKDFPKKQVQALFRYADGHERSKGILIFCFYEMLYLRAGGDGKQFDLTTNTAVTPIKPDTWYRAVMTYDGKTARTYINGKLAVSKDMVIMKPVQHSYLLIGSSGDIYGYGFKGIIGQVKVFDRALTDAEVTELQTAE